MANEKQTGWHNQGRKRFNDGLKGLLAEYCDYGTLLIAFLQSFSKKILV